MDDLSGPIGNLVKNRISLPVLDLLDDNSLNNLEMSLGDIDCINQQSSVRIEVNISSVNNFVDELLE